MISNDDVYQHPEYLVETDWLEQHLDDPELRVFDCSVNVKVNPNAALKIHAPFVYQSGRLNFDKIHIPYSGFIDILSDPSDASSHLPLMMPSENQFSEMMSQYGISQESHVVLYSTTESNWATRVWWMLRAYGFNNVVILNGGFKKWLSERRPVSDLPCRYQSAQFISDRQLYFFVDKDDVLSAIGDDNICIINALPAAIYDGSSDIYFGRKGRISQSVNVPFVSLHEPETGCYFPAKQLHELYDAVNIKKVDKIIAYCGGGIAASNTAFTLSLLGYENVAVYDGSMLEWGNEPLLPMSIG